MRVQFNYTQEDMVDASMRVQARSKTIRSIRWRALLWSAGFTWVLTWLLVFAVFRASTLGFLLGLFLALVTALVYPGLNRSRIEKSLRKLHQESFGNVNDFVCEVELTPAGVLIRQQSSQMTIEWEKVEEILVTADSVDIFSSGLGVIVRKRAFKSVDEQTQFFELAQNFAAQARHAQGDVQ